MYLLHSNTFLIEYYENQNLILVILSLFASYKNYFYSAISSVKLYKKKIFERNFPLRKNNSSMTKINIVLN